LKNTTDTLAIMCLLTVIKTKFMSLQKCNTSMLSIFVAIALHIKRIGVLSVLAILYLSIYTVNFGAILVHFSNENSVDDKDFPITWMATAHAVEETVGDNFPAVSYSQNSGSKNWNGNWVEVGESDGTSAGIARVNSSLCTSGNCLRLGVPSGNSAQTYNDKGVYRKVDLSGAISATLSFVYRSGVNNGSQTVVLSVYNGSAWIDLKNYYIDSTKTSPTSATFNLLNYDANITRIRFLASGSNAVIGMYIDDIEINYEIVVPSKLSVSTENVIQEYDVSSYGGSGQDKTGTVEIRDAGLSLYLEGNRWKKIDFPYTVTENTMIEFDFQSTVQGEILGMGFDNDLSVSSDKSFKVYGTQNWGISDFDTYSGSGITHFTIPVGQFYTGNFQYLFFINDNDSNLTSNSLYSNIIVYEKNITGSLTGNLNVDNAFEAYISTDNSVQGTLLTSGTDWPTTYTLASSLTAGQDYYLHIKATDYGVIAGFLGEFKIGGSDHTFSNGQTTLNTNTSDWSVSTTGWENYQSVTAYGVNGDSPSPWNRIMSDISATAQWIWSSNNPADNINYFSARIVTSTIHPLAEYRFEETTWDGSPDEILDSTGNGHHAQALRDSILVNPPTAVAPAALSGDPGTCGYASQSSGAIQVTGLPLDTSTIGVKTTVTFWMNWNGIENVMPIGWNVHDIWLVSGSMGFNTGGGDVYGISSAGLANGWHHVAAEFTNGSVTNNRIHIDGVEQVLTQRRNSPNNGRAFVNSEFRIGGWSINTSYDFQGLIDEVRIYQDALSTTQINTIMNEVHPCNIPIIDHYQIIHDSNGLTCAPEKVLIRACSDANCSSFDNTINTTVTMQVNGGADQNITIINGSSVNESFVYTDSDNPAVLSLTSDYSCSDTSNNSAGCAVNFAKAGFLLNLDNHQSCTTPNLTIKAVRFIGSGLDCAPAYTGNQSVDFIFNYSDPFNGTEVPSLATVDMAAATVTQTRTITFDDTGTANLSFNYQDAGKIRINVNDAAGVGLAASFVTTVIRPAKLIVASPDTNADCATSNAANATCSVFKTAGAQFNLNITAACSNDTVTENFRMNNIPLTVSTIAPNVDNLVTLGVTNINVLTADNGIHKISNQTVSEVGVFTITATPPMNGYFGETIPAAVSANIGRFIPDYFKQTIKATLGPTLGDEGSLTVNHNNDSGACQMADWAYSGQLTDDIGGNPQGSIRYFNSPTLTITAYNSADEITENYVDNFAKLMFLTTDTDNKISFKQPEKTHINGLPLTGTFPELGEIVNLGGGILTYQLSEKDHFVYTRNASSEISPFNAEFELPFNVFKDSDGVTFKASTAVIDYFETPKFYKREATPSVSAFNNTIEIRFGRLRLKNSFGPETSDLPQPMQLEHFDGTAFITTSDNNCASYDIANASFDPAPAPNVLVLTDSKVVLADSSTGKFSTGSTNAIMLEAPGAGKQGTFIVTYDIFDWLKYDWDNDGVYINPSANATFGRYRGNDRIIYSREVFR